jgi:HEAT repeat protein
MSGWSPLPDSCRELDLAAVEAELVKSKCNIAAAAKALNVPASDLRRLVTWGPLAAAVSEQVEQAIDRAEAVLIDGLADSDALVRLKAASALLRLSPAGRRRGFGRGAVEREKSGAPAGDVSLKWRDS